MKLPAPLQPHWDRLAPRERRSVLAAAALVGLALLWWIALAPALRTLQGAETQHRVLDAQLQTMLRLQAEAQALQSRPKLAFDEAVRALEASVKQRFGPAAQLSVAGERATVTLKGAPAAAVSEWLAQARVDARALPAEARLLRSPSAVTATGPTWDGVLVMNLPAR
ncbi:MAG: ral secretion pathway protein GspM [Rhodoferax sp.]|nr:ral secretion pathway protein GspM [Rhodoferax sp.]